ncbi:MAG: hypothetical protein EON48_11875 [Acetobacteraceae bacterium]|nr:MAG: hypothetical protein EON48_11875 [Acetobacteraceae bacterium]
MTIQPKTMTAADLLRSEADLLEVGVTLQNKGLELLLAEMRALAALMPGVDSSQPTDAEIEAGFDNMPI